MRVEEVLAAHSAIEALATINTPIGDPKVSYAISWLLQKKRRVADIYKAYSDAQSDLIKTLTGGGSSLMISDPAYPEYDERNRTLLDQDEDVRLRTIPWQIINCGIAPSVLDRIMPLVEEIPEDAEPAVAPVPPEMMAGAAPSAMNLPQAAPAASTPVPQAARPVARAKRKAT